VKGKVIPQFCIPKHHNLCHFSKDVQNHGMMDNGSSKITEVLHVPNCKVTYQSTSQKGYTTQILDQLQHIDSLHLFASILKGIGVNSGPIIILLLLSLFWKKSKHFLLILLEMLLSSQNGLRNIHIWLTLWWTGLLHWIWYQQSCDSLYMRTLA